MNTKSFFYCRLDRMIASILLFIIVINHRHTTTPTTLLSWAESWSPNLAMGKKIILLTLTDTAVSGWTRSRASCKSTRPPCSAPASTSTWSSSATSPPSGPPSSPSSTCPTQSTIIPSLKRCFFTPWSKILKSTSVWIWILSFRLWLLQYHNPGQHGIICKSICFKVFSFTFCIKGSCENLRILL